MLNKVKFGRKFYVITICSLVFSSIFAFPLTSMARYDEPTVMTRDANNIEDTSATLNGLEGGNGLSTRAWFEYGRDALDLATTTTKGSYGTDENDYHKNISGLRRDTLYYFRAVAQNSEGKVYGEIFSFRTGINYNYNNDYNYYDSYNYQNYYDYSYPSYSNQTVTAPTAVTTGATDISSSSAQLNSLILDSANSFFTNSWFEWGPTPALGIKTEVTTVNANPAVRHAHTLSGLTPQTTYYFRAIAENSRWRNIGSVLSFTTSGGVNPGANVTYIVEEPTPTPEPTQTTPEETKTAAPAEKETSRATVSSLVASAIGVDSFLPKNIFGWLVLIILALILILLTRHPHLKIGNRGEDHAQ